MVRAVAVLMLLQTKPFQNILLHVTQKCSMLLSPDILSAASPYSLFLTLLAGGIWRLSALSLRYDHTCKQIEFYSFHSRWTPFTHVCLLWPEHSAALNRGLK